MQKYADYIKRIEIDSLWSGKKHIVWELSPKVNILSGINGQGKSTIINKVVKGLAQGGEFPSHMLKGVRLDVEPEDARWIRYDMIRSLDSNLAQVMADEEGSLRQVLPVTLIWLALWALIYWILITWTDSTVPLCDSFTTSLSMVAMWALAQKYAEQWLLWFVVDAVCTVLYIYKQIPFTAALYAFYTLIALLGYRQWLRMISSSNN